MKYYASGTINPTFLTETSSRSGFYSKNGTGILIKNCTAERDILNSSINNRAGFILEGTENGTKIIDCLACEFTDKTPFTITSEEGDLKQKMSPGYGIQLGMEQEKKIVLQNGYLRGGGGSNMTQVSKDSSWSSNGTYVGAINDTKIITLRRDDISLVLDDSQNSGPLYFGTINEPIHKKIAWRPGATTPYLIAVGTTPYTGVTAPINASLHTVNFTPGSPADFYTTRNSIVFNSGSTVEDLSWIDSNYLIVVGSDRTEIFNSSLVTQDSHDFTTPTLTNVSASPDGNWVIVGGSSGGNTFVGEFAMVSSSALPSPTTNQSLAATAG
ncbi:MAG: hypothetical protein KAR20_29945, partial [Candidatus Heimdallarchaeota archaeon]|nr:hypothetical protein [Candidatus Heimdallarchaeota archaeon]